MSYNTYVCSKGVLLVAFSKGRTMLMPWNVREIVLMKSDLTVHDAINITQKLQITHAWLKIIFLCSRMKRMGTPKSLLLHLLFISMSLGQICGFQIALCLLARVS